MNIDNAVDLAKRLMWVNKLRGWRVCLNKDLANMGLCDYAAKTIYLSSTLVLLCKYGSVRNTILHEIAHALTPGHGHDAVWRRKCLILGGDGKDTFDLRSALTDLDYLAYLL